MQDRIAPQPNLQRLLETALQEAQLSNPRFSLRALAKRLKVSPSILSDFLTGKRKVTKKTAEKFLNGLAVDPQMRDQALQSFGAKKEEDGKVRKVLQLSADEFNFVSDWHTFAIFVLAEQPDFKANAKVLAKKLSITESQARKSLERLFRLEILKKEAGERVKLLKPNLTTTTDIPSVAIRRRLNEDLDQARKALEELEVQERDFSSIMMLGSPKRIELIKDRIQAFRREICGLLESDPMSEKTELFQFNAQFFPATRTERPKSRSQS